MNFPRVNNKDLRELLRKAQDQGCVITLSGQDHIRVTAPNGKIVMCPGTSRSIRTIKNTRAELRRIGVDV